jgi:Abnormal spindle-like microcephaly-assoc'd, ASPM-SPD-2-Hydin/Protein of unknown function (DUF1573)
LETPLFAKTLSLLPLALLLNQIALPQNKVTYAGDDKRTGWYKDQPLLDPATVGGSGFGKLFDTAINGQVYAQPLVSNGILFVATETNWIYGLDPLTGDIKWARNTGPAWNISDVGCGDLAPSMGITGTPVIDTESGTAYFVSKTYLNGTSGPAAMFMHAVDIQSGAEREHFPVFITGPAQNDPASSFEATRLNNRTALLLMNGVVYAAMGAMCDIGPYKGWVVGVSSTGEVRAIWASVPGALNGGGIWMSGGGLVSDQPGRLFFSTGNGYDSTPNGVYKSSDPQTKTSESVVRLATKPDGSLALDNFFSPYDALSLDSWDADFGSGAPTALPEEFFGTADHPKLLVVAGKQGYVYLLDRDDLGGQKMGVGGGDAVVSRIGPYGGVWSRPAVWPGDGGYIYMPTGSSGPTPGPTGGVFRVYKYGLDGTGNPSLSLAATSAESFGGYSSSPIVTSNGTTSGSAMVWLIRVPDSTGNNAQLLGYEAVPTLGQLTLRFSAPIGQGSKFVPPGVGPARLYVGTRDGHLLGFGVPAAALLSAPLTQFGGVTVGEAATAKITVAANKSVHVQAIETTNPVFQLDAQDLPVSLSQQDTLTVTVHFSPIKEGVVSGALRVTTDQGPVEFSLSGSGRLPGPHLQVSPAVLSLGGTITGNSLIGTAILTNTGAESLLISAIRSPGNPFYLVGAPPANTQIASGQSLTLTVQFSPSTVGSFTDTINITSNGGNSAIKLSGSAALPGNFDVSTDAINFGTLGVGSSSTLSFKIFNSGFSPLTITKSKGPIRGQFNSLETLNEGTILQPGETRMIDIRFAPTAGGSFSDTFILNSDTATGMKVITFEGTAVQASGSISSVVGVTPENVMLTESGLADWIRWNSADLTRFTAMNAPTSQFGTLSLIGSGHVKVITDQSVKFCWLNGTPTTEAFGSTNGIAVSENKGGFRLTAPADTDVHTLRVYVGVQRAAGSFVSSLTDGSAPAVVDSTFSNLDGAESHVYTITYRASKLGQSLTVAWIKTRGTGTISLSAAALVAHAATLTGSSNASNAPVNLSTEGSTDWIRWAQGDPETRNTNVKAISNYSSIGEGQVYPYGDDPRPFAWFDGSIRLKTDHDTSGVFTPGIGNGFSFRAPADRSVRTLIVHVGGWYSSGTFTAHLSDGSQPDWVDVSPLVNGQYDRNYQITYSAASARQTLTISWTMSSGAGNVTLNAASLGCRGESACLLPITTDSNATSSLTSEGASDWVSWAGLVPVRKASPTESISYRSAGIGSILEYGDDPRLLSWQDGDSQPTSLGDRRGIFTAGVGNGFTIEVPADPLERTLTLHVGGWNSAGTLLAHLSDGSQPDWVDVTPIAADQYDRNYRISYRSASLGQTLTVSWIMSSGGGNVTLNGAAIAVTLLQ